MKKLNEIIELALLEQGVFVETESTFTPLDEQTADAVCKGLIEDHNVDKFKSRFIKSCLMKGRLIKDLGMFNNKQVYQLCRAMNKGLDYSIFADYEVSSYSMEKLIDLKLKGVDLEEFYYPGISCFILKLIELCIDHKLDYTKILTRYLKKDECEKLEKLLPIAASQKLDESFYADLTINHLNYLDNRFFWMADEGYRLDHALKIYTDCSSWLNDLKYENVTADEFEKIYKLLEDNSFKRDYSLDIILESVRSGKTIQEILDATVDEESLKEAELRTFLNNRHYSFSDDVIKDLLIYTTFESNQKARRSGNGFMKLGHPAIPTPMSYPTSKPEKKKIFGGTVSIREDLIDFLAICPEFLELRSKTSIVSLLNLLMEKLSKDEAQDVVVEKIKLLIAERPSVLDNLAPDSKSVSLDTDLIKDKTISDDYFVMLFNNFRRTEDYDALKAVSLEFLIAISKRNWSSHPSDWPAFLKLYDLNLSDELIELAICNFSYDSCSSNEEIVSIIEACMHFKAYEFNDVSQIISLVKYNGFDAKDCIEILKSSHSAYYAKILIGANSLGLDISTYLSKKMAPLTVREKLLKEALVLKKVKDRKDFYRVVS